MYNIQYESMMNKPKNIDKLSKNVRKYLKIYKIQFYLKYSNKNEL